MDYKMGVYERFLNNQLQRCSNSRYERENNKKARQSWVWCKGEQVVTMNYFFDQCGAQNRRIERHTRIAQISAVISAVCLLSVIVIIAILL